MRGVRVLILACASVAAMAAMWLMRGAIESRATVSAPAVSVAAREPAKPAVQAPKTIDVLVAARDIPIGRTLEGNDVKWQAFPAEIVSPYFYARQDDENAVQTVTGTAARTLIRAGEPLSTEKIVNLQGAGVMASLLRKGMRAVAVPISDITGAGGFILPGDFVDLLLTRQINVEEFNPSTGLIDRTVTHNQTDTVMATVRVLAIDQRLAETTDNGNASAIGNTATIELTPDQVELISLTRQIAKQERGFLTLSLRSFSELVEEYGEDIDKIMPETILDLQALARSKIERANEMRELAEQFQAEQHALKRRRDEEARAQTQRLRAAQNGTAPANGAPAPAPEDDGVVLVRNGAAIKVRTTSTPATEANR